MEILKNIENKMKHIRNFKMFLNEMYTESDIPLFDNHPNWKQGDNWKGNDGDINFTYVNDKFEIVVEFWDPDNTYTVGFKEIGDKNIVPETDRYQTGNLKTMEDVQYAVDKMMTFLEKY